MVGRVSKGNCPGGAYNPPGRSRSQGHLGKKAHKMLQRSSGQALGYTTGPGGGPINTVSGVSV